MDDKAYSNKGVLGKLVALATIYYEEAVCDVLEG